jgi:type VI secretion system protein ImpF
LPAPLFERLTQAVEDLGAHGEPYRSHTLADALVSIRAEIRRILNTRVPPGSIFPPFSASVIHYGLPNFSHVSAASALERDALAELLARVIGAFEPRLRQVRITLEATLANRRALVGRLDAVLHLGIVSESVCFSLNLHTVDGTALVGEVIDVEQVS